MENKDLSRGGDILGSGTAEKKPKKGLSIGKKVGLGLGAVTVLGGGLSQAIPVVRHAEAEFLSHIKGDNLKVDYAQLIKEESLGPQQTNESVSWWQEIPKKKIQSLTKIPLINSIGDEHKFAVSPSLQQRAADAGYEIIYQGDPDDTTGRTVITKGRQTSSKDWNVEDIGFGKAGTTLRGIFKAWVPDPEDPTQKDHVYALVVDPVSKKEALVSLQIRQVRPAAYKAPDERFQGPTYVAFAPTRFIIDDLNDGPSKIELKTKQPKKTIEYPTLNDLLRIRSLKLTNLAMPGDYVKIHLQSTGILDQGGQQYKPRTHEKGIATATLFEIRRFGGEEQWRSELSP